MAVLSKIRERSLFLIIVIGLALFAFVLDPSSIADFFGADKVNEMGSVNGEVISRQEFASALESYKEQTGGRVSEMQAAKSVWENLVRTKIYEGQLENAGITIGDEDIMSSLYENSSIQNDPRFQTSEIFDKNKFKQYLASVKEEKNEEWAAWQSYMTSIKRNQMQGAYENLVSAGLGATLIEGKEQYFYDNTEVSAEFVQYPFESVPDSLVSVTKKEVEDYIKKNKSKYQVDASRDINFVKFDVEATKEDENAIKNEVAKLLDDSTVGQNMVVKGLKTTTDYLAFFEENKSDLPYDKESVKFKNDFSDKIADTLFNMNVNNVYGPYKESGYYKLSKVTEIIQIPDSVKAAHILIPFVGSQSAVAETKDTEEQAKVKADSILEVVKKSSDKFKDIAKELSADKSNSEKGGELDWFTYNTMVPEFRDFCFNNKTGDYGVVKTIFGFHIINIQDQKNLQNAIKLATYARKIEPSKETENIVFQNAETFAQELSKGSSIESLAKEKNLKVQPAVGIKALDDNVPGLGKERSVVTWAFDKDIKEGDYKRFDIDGGHYAVAVLSTKTSKGLMPVNKAMVEVKDILIKEKKAKIMSEKMKGATLKEIAEGLKLTVKTSGGVNLKSSTITGAGYEPKVVGAMIGAKKDEVKKSVIGDRGVYAFKVTKKTLPEELPDYNTYRKRIANQRKNQKYRIYQAIKKATDLKDNVASFYGITE